MLPWKCLETTHIEKWENNKHDVTRKFLAWVSSVWELRGWNGKENLWCLVMLWLSSSFQWVPFPLSGILNFHASQSHFWEQVSTRYFFLLAAGIVAWVFLAQSTAVTNKELIMAFLSTYLFSEFMDWVNWMTFLFISFPYYQVIGWNCL